MKHIRYPRKRALTGSHSGHVAGFKPSADRKLLQVFNKIGTPENSTFIPDDFQLESVDKIQKVDVLVSAPTGSGKTWIAVQAMKKVLSEGKNCWYASPLKALSNSKYHEFEEEFGKENVGVITGDRKENTDAKIIVGTTEILRNQLYDSMANSSDFDADLVILDEAHYLGDVDRGVVWEEVMIYLPERIRLLMLSATIPNDIEISEWLMHIRKHPCHVVHSDKRTVPIFPLYQLPDGEIVPLSGLDGISPKIEKHIKKTRDKTFRSVRNTVHYEDVLKVLKKYNLLPAVFFLKSRRDCNKALQSSKRYIISNDKSEILKKRLDNILQDYPFLAEHAQIKNLIYHGLASHHGGQLPHWKIIIEMLMNEGLLDAIFSTSTVAAGVNFPARTVVLAQSDRFNGKEFISLSSTELHQATGRAGRRGKDKIGFAVMLPGPFQDPHLIIKLLDNPPDPIESQIKINFSMCLNLLMSQNPPEIQSLLKLSFGTFQNAESLCALEKERDIVLDQFKKKIKEGICKSCSDVINRIESRKAQLKHLSRLRKKMKLYLKKNHSNKAQAVGSEIDSVSAGIAALPCGKCSCFANCHRDRANRFAKLANKAALITEEFETEQNALWNEFMRHLDFLILNGFADKSGKLTNDGLWAAKLRLDQPLIIAELIRKGLFNNLTSELLAGIIAVFVNDRYRDVDISPTVAWNKRILQNSYYKMKNAVEEIISLKKAHDFDVPQMQFWPAASLYTWACGETWENVIKLTGVDEGDLAMLIYRTADNLRQIKSLKNTHPYLADKAKKGIELLLREPVEITG